MNPEKADQQIQSIYNFISCQTVATECFTHASEYIRDRVINHLNLKYSKNEGNRALNRKMYKLKQLEIKKFNSAFIRYKEANDRMLGHFEEWSKSEVIDEKVDILYSHLYNEK